MGGIAGIRRHARGTDVHDALERMASRLHHRGPDGTDVWVGDDVGLARTRSALAGGPDAPVHADDGRWALVLDGRITNHHELRAQLDHPFRTTCDTEVVLAGLSLEGISFVERLEGQFALAAHDVRARTTHLVRDRLGARPLHYRHVPGGIVFASEVKALLAAGPPPQVDDRSLDAYLTDRSVPSPDTLFEGVKKVRPAHRVAIAPTGRLQETRYWTPPELDPAGTWCDEDAIESVGDGVREAVRTALPTDVPVGVLLAHGLSSDLVVAHARQLREEEPVHTFSAALDDADHPPPWGRRLGALLGTRHHQVVVRAEDVRDLWTLVSWHRESPLSEPADVVAHLLARAAREHVGTVLSGAGGDELFGGSPEHRHPRLAGPPARLPAAVRSALEMPIARRVGVAHHRPAAFSTAERQALLGTGPSPDRRAQVAAGADPLDRMLRQDLRHWLPDTVLERADRMAGAASLELLLPLLDDRLTELAFRLPSSVKVRAGTTKWVLRQAARPLLPDAVVDRQDDLPHVPLERWMARVLHEVARERLTSRDSWVGQVLDRSIVNSLVHRREHSAGEEGRLWTLLCLEMWHEAFFDAAPPVPRTRTGSHDTAPAQPVATA